MYLTSEEKQAISSATRTAKRNFAYYQNALWFTGWDTAVMCDAALRCSISDGIRMGEKPRTEFFTALAKFHYELEDSERYIVIADIPARQIGGSITRMTRIYHERYYEYAGAWLDKQNEVVLAALTLAPRITAPMPVRVFSDFIGAVRLQLSKEVKGTCLCGLRSSHDVCAVCGTGGKP